MSELALSLAMIAAIALIGGGLWLIVRKSDRKRGALMLVAALVLIINVVIWTMPLPR